MFPNWTPHMNTSRRFHVTAAFARIRPKKQKPKESGAKPTETLGFGCVWSPPDVWWCGDVTALVSRVEEKIEQTTVLSDVRRQQSIILAAV